MKKRSKRGIELEIQLICTYHYEYEDKLQTKPSKKLHGASPSKTAESKRKKKNISERKIPSEGLIDNHNYTKANFSRRFLGWTRSRYYRLFNVMFQLNCEERHGQDEMRKYGVHSCTYMLKLLWLTNLGIEDLNEPDFRWVHKRPKVNACTYRRHLHFVRSCSKFYCALTR